MPDETQDSSERIKAALNYLESDAVVWLRSSKRMAKTSHDVSELKVPSMLAGGIFFALVPNYNALCDHVQALLADGGRNFDVIGTSILENVRSYRLRDAEAAADFDDVAKRHGRDDLGAKGRMA